MDEALIVQELRLIYSFKDLLEISKIARSSYYYLIRKSTKIDKYKELKEKIFEIFHKHKGRYGYRRIHLSLINLGIKINHKTVYKLMKALNLKSLVRVKKYKSYKGKVGKTAENILNRNFKVDSFCKKWVTDITEFKVNNKKIYLSPIMDLYNSEIISYSIAYSPNYLLVKNMLNKAIEKVKYTKGIILHSDQGWHYQMKPYQRFLIENGIIQSMSRKGNCLDNAMIENFFGLLKSELFYLKKYKSVEELRVDIDEYIYYYNNYRIKEKLKGQSPISFRTSSLISA